MIRGNMTIQAISPKDLLIYLCLRRYQNSVTGESSVPIAKIVKQTGASPVTILSSLDRLKASGHISYVKRGRQNFYKFPSTIEATSYKFLDEEISHAEKIKRAVKVAYVPDTKDNSSNQVSDSKLYDFVVQLEETVTHLSGHVRTLATELDNVRKCMSVITGQPYTPMNLD